MAKPRRGDAIDVSIDDLAFGGEGGRTRRRVRDVRPGRPAGRPASRPRDRDAGTLRPRPSIEAVATPVATTASTGALPVLRPLRGLPAAAHAYAAAARVQGEAGPRLSRAARRLAGLRAAPDPGRAPDAYGYRNKMEFTVAREPGEPVVGLHEADRYDVVIDIERCLLQSETMNALLDEMRRQTRRAPSAGVGPGVTEQGLLRFVTLREGRRTGEAMVNIVAASPDVETLGPWPRPSRRVPRPWPASCSTSTPRRPSVAVGTEEHVLLGRDHHHRIARTACASRCRPTRSSRRTRVQAERLFALVRGRLRARRRARPSLDLYSGTGRDQPPARAALPARLRDRGGPGRGGRRGPERAGQRHRELHVPHGRGPPRAARAHRRRRRGRHGGRRSAARGVPSQGADRPRGAGRGPHRVRVVQPVDARARRRRARRAAATGSSGCSRSTCSPRRRTSRRSPVFDGRDAHPPVAIGQSIQGHAATRPWRSHPRAEPAPPSPVQSTRSTQPRAPEAGHPRGEAASRSPLKNTP